MNFLAAVDLILTESQNHDPAFLPVKLVLNIQTSGDNLPNQLGFEEYCNFILFIFLSYNSLNSGCDSIDAILKPFVVSYRQSSFGRNTTQRLSEQKFKCQNVFQRKLLDFFDKTSY